LKCTYLQLRWPPPTSTSSRFQFVVVAWARAPPSSGLLHRSECWSPRHPTTSMWTFCSTEHLSQRHKDGRPLDYSRVQERLTRRVRWHVFEDLAQSLNDVIIIDFFTRHPRRIFIACVLIPEGISGHQRLHPPLHKAEGHLLGPQPSLSQGLDLLQQLG
jgi:hypothetical protein